MATEPIAQTAVDAYGNPNLHRAALKAADDFTLLTQINKASVVMLRDKKIVPEPVAARLARGIIAVDESNARTGAERPRDYLKYEPQLVAAAGADASMLHVGRSRQDLASTMTRMYLRETLLAAFDSLAAARDRALSMGEKYPDALMPAYTHGVQAQPTTVGHYMHALATALARDAVRLRAAYATLNLSPLGTAVLGNSGYPIDREQLAALLGFDGLVENAYDANHIAPVDSGLEVATVLAISAVHIGQFAQDMTAQYADPSPWFLLTDGKLTGGSSIMPQKRNPTALTTLRHQASLVIGAMNSTFLLAHNTNTGMYDYRRPNAIPTLDSAALFGLLADVLDGIVVNAPRALDEINAEYSTMTEVADFLMLKAGVPFRIGHHFAADLAKFGRSRGLTPIQIPYAEAQRIYREDTKAELPLSEADFKQALSAEYMVRSRKGTGGTQPEEVKRMLAAARTALGGDMGWSGAQKKRLEAAQASLASAFGALAGGSPTSRKP